MSLAATHRLHTPKAVCVICGSVERLLLLYGSGRRPESFPVRGTAGCCHGMKRLFETDDPHHLVAVVLSSSGDLVGPHLVFEITLGPAPPVVSSRLGLPVEDRLVVACERPNARALLTAHFDRGDVADLRRT